MSRMLLPLLAAALLGLFAWVFGPVERTVEDRDLAGLRIDPDSLAEGRHYGPFLKDSVLGLLQAIDSSGRMARVEVQGDSVRFERPDAFSPSRFRRIFQNQRSAKDFRRLKNSPISMLPGEDKGFVAPIRVIDGKEYLVLPYDVLAGWMAEFGSRR